MDSDRGGFSLGEVVTLQGIDTKKIGDVFTYLHSAWSAPFQIIVATGLLIQVLNWAALGGVIGMLLVIFLNDYERK